jgi:hypothetical protein
VKEPQYILSPISSGSIGIFGYVIDHLALATIVLHKNAVCCGGWCSCSYKSIHFSEMSLSPFQTPFAHKAIKSGQDPGIGIYLLKNKIAKSVGASKRYFSFNFVKQSFPWEQYRFCHPQGAFFFIANTANKVS